MRNQRNGMEANLVMATGDVNFMMTEKKGEAMQTVTVAIADIDPGRR